MEKTELLTLALREALPEFPSRVQQLKRPDDVGSDKFFRPVNGSVHVRRRGKMHDRAGAMPAKQVGDERGIADIAMHKCVRRVVAHGIQVAQITGIGERIEIDDARGLIRKPLQDEIGADETGAAGYE